MLRPEARVLPDHALIPRSNLVAPPERFTHELAAEAPYRFDRPEEGGDPDGVLPAGTPVALVREGPERLRVATGDGLAVDVPRASVRELP